MVCVDDMNDWVGCLGGYEGQLDQSHTPNIDRLARRGVLFTNAHASSPKCGPSRAAIFTGRVASSTGLYGNGEWIRPHLGKAVVTLPEHFMLNGYNAVGAGKVFHHTAGFNPPDQWTAFQNQIYDDPWDRPSRVTYPQVTFVPRPPGHPFNGIEPVLHEFDWGPIPGKPHDEYGDVRATDYIIANLHATASVQSRPNSKPFFLALGLFHPHLPWLTPARYFAPFEVDDMRMPEALASDTDDLPQAAFKFVNDQRSRWEAVQNAGKQKQMVQAYLASIAFADAQLGRVLDALEETGLADETIVVFWSDHGWHFGEKDHLMKSTLWEEATRVPLIVAGPGIETGASAEAVTLVDLYPTLVELCGLSPREQLDGLSLTPLLNNPAASRDRPALITFGRGNHAVRDERWRYIRYADGSGELYDHRHDPKEWRNLLAGDTADAYAPVVKRLARWIPQAEAPKAPGKGAYDFDWKTHTWTVKATGEVRR
jgi:arylsulfatase A-like enzyme